MKKIIKYGVTLLLILSVSKSINAQEYYNIYKTFDAVMLQTQGNQTTEQILNGATIILPNNSNKLNLLLNIPYSVIDNEFVADSAHSTGLLFSLTIDIDRIEIQENLTSSKRFITHGMLSLNGITKWVTVSYMPIASGTEEDGNFNISMIIQFNASDFNLDMLNSSRQFQFKIDNAKVNRV
ncbi:MAG: hypothetical protein ABI280_02880 [Ginsengibacter sp.]